MKGPTIGIVGISTPSANARSFARERGTAVHIIVSSLARNINTEAQFGSLETGIIAVFFGEADIVYPPTSNNFFAQFAAEERINSTAQAGTTAQFRLFPSAYRIIADLSFLVVVAEVSKNLRPLIATRCAAGQGSRTLAVLDPWLDPRSIDTSQ